MVWKSHKKIKNRITIWSSNLISGNISKKLRTKPRKHICKLIFTTALFSITKRWKQFKYPLMDEWIKEMWYIRRLKYKIDFKKKNEGIPVACYNMDIVWTLRHKKTKAVWFHLQLKIIETERMLVARSW